MKTIYRACNLCEAICGLEIQYDEIKNQIISIKGDKNDPLSQGHICPKGASIADIYYDPDRLKKPLRKYKNQWEEISWEEAIQYTKENIKKIQEKYGHNAIGVYLGNPNVHNYGSQLYGSRFIKSLKTKNIFSATSVDQLPHHFVSYFMLGHPNLLPIPDLDRTYYFLILGANPLASNGSLMTSPNIRERLKHIKERGKVIVIDPRKTETAEFATEHYFIYPETDIFFLLSFLKFIYKNNYIRLNHLQPLIKEDIKSEIETILSFFPDKDLENLTEKYTGIKKEILSKIYYEFCNSPNAILYGRIGVSTQRFGALSLWLIYLINILTGNFDQIGGMMFTSPAIDLIGKVERKNLYARYFSSVTNTPEFMGEFPVSILSDEILTDHPEAIKGMILIAGNPVLSTPNGNRLRLAFQKLEFLVSIDFYKNESNQYANIILPPTSPLEHEHYDITFLTLAIRNYAKYSEPVFPKSNEAYDDWEIFVQLMDSKRIIKPIELLNQMLKNGPYKLTLEELKKHPHGIDLGPLKPNLKERISEIILFPEIFKNALKDFSKQYSEYFSYLEENLSRNIFLLIGRRELRSNNSWMHNIPRLIKGEERCKVWINTKDAKRLNLNENQFVTIVSDAGEITIAVHITDKIMEGVISIPHGYGHSITDDISWQNAKQLKSNASINDLTIHQRYDQLCYNAAFNGTPVRIINN
ncbi:MAG: oxidoreductase [Leptospiraceae bacterium]|nr:MAG: oxidoreductase [Leptospiraceae bacterium]